MSEEHDQIWVALELMRGGQTVLFRGTMAQSDFDAITSGSYTAPFVTLQNVHWVESVWSEQEGSWTNKVTVYGRDREWRWHTGAMHIRPDSIFSLADLRDCSSVVGKSDEI
ncbi:MAG TPA: hypothetical protein VKS79_21845 [Gemmataceae bacterium]|nr:hypothetical protein [Gemmataceae bacterium]